MCGHGDVETTSKKESVSGHGDIETTSKEESDHGNMKTARKWCLFKAL